MVNISNSDIKLKFTTIYNIDRQVNDIRDMKKILYERNSDSDIILDDYYGKLFTRSVYENNNSIYGNSAIMDYYEDFDGKYEIIDFLRVPYRKIPVFRVYSNNEAKAIINDIKEKRENLQVLLRGQVKQYSLPKRSDNELFKLYGDKNAVEPSFLSSFCREKLDEKFIRCLWNWQGRILLNDIYIDLRKKLPGEQLQEFIDSRNRIEGTMYLSYFSLGMAQHYGLPSIGLDLTDNYETALSFASNILVPEKNGNFTSKKNTDFSQSMIYVFSCPRNVVFSYKNTKPKHFPICRPDLQDAWFGYVGWGNAINQMAMYLDCCIKVTPELYDEIEPEYFKKLFPSRDKDPILEIFYNLKNNQNYSDIVRNVFSKVYDLSFS